MKATFLIALIISTASGVQVHSQAKAIKSAPESNPHPVLLAQQKSSEAFPIIEEGTRCTDFGRKIGNYNKNIEECAS